MDWILGTMAVFVAYPVLAAVIGLLLIGLGRMVRRWTPAIIGVIWLLYALYETGMQLRWLCSGECNIRIDLLAIYPALLFSLVVAIVALFLGARARRVLRS